MDRVVHVGEGGGLLEHEGDGGENGGEHDEEGHEGADGAVLQLEDVPLEEPLQLIVLEAVPVEEEAREAHLAVPAHRLHAVVHSRGLSVTKVVGIVKGFGGKFDIR